MSRLRKEEHYPFFSGLILFLMLYFITSSFNNSSNIKDKKMINSEISYNAILNNESQMDNIIEKLKKELSISCTDDQEDELLLMNAIYDNKNLDESDKKVFYGFYSLVSDIQSIDRDRAYYALYDVKVNRAVRDKSTSSSILGYYNNISNTIYMYENPENKVLIHEGIHCLFHSDGASSLPEFFTEGMTELLANEFFSNDPFLEDTNYPYEVSYVKMLCELVGKDVVLETFTTGDFSLILKKIDEYNNTELSSYEILNIYEDAFNTYENKKNSLYTTNDRWKAYDCLNDIYKNNSNNSINQREFNYFHELSASVFEEDPAEFYRDYIYYYGILEKAYFSKDLMEKYPEINFQPFYERNKILLKK